jgi:hypothetical protein
VSTALGLRPGWKSLPERNTLAYFASYICVEERSFIALATVANVLKLIEFVTQSPEWRNHLKVLF